MQAPDNRAARLAAGRLIGRSLVETPGADAVFLSGSLVEGMGNAASDIDVYLIGPRLSAERRTLGAGRMRVDAHLVPYERLCSAVDRVLAADLSASAGEVPTAGADLELAARLWSAEFLADTGTVGALRDRLRSGATQFRRQMIRHWLTAVHLAMEDVSGFRADGDGDACLLAGRTALLGAGKAVAAACGEFHLGSKWVWRQLERSAPEGFPLTWFRTLLRGDLLCGGVPSPDDLERLVQTCSIAAATLGWQGVPLDEWPWRQSSSGPLNRVADCFPRVHTEAVTAAVIGRRRVRMRPDVALVWGLCNGVTEEELVERAGRLRHRAVAYQRLDPDRCRALVARLLDAGLLLRTRG
ncbi:hypothetical protein LG634_19375 [Streptomyces bambusae]|uniref:hypothetical protein n=1 Tax=Streptomyces bambusae TaxID=1550616 RepID=UPI001CFCCFF7|nr:hypothetical protein [Streptomyces bambusae]MCB5166992.1 hypothetical protein [Streptomyces bambusae]